jgi:uncharacterized protein (TIGR01244 family)
MADRIRVGGGMRVGTGQPTEADLRRLWEEGFRSVVDLRVEAEGDQPLPPGRERAGAESLGLRYVHLPVPADRPPDEVMLDRFRREVCQLPAPVFVHCASGKRSGSFGIALEAVLADDTGDAAVARIDELGIAYGPDEARNRIRRWVDRHSRQAGAARPAPPRAPSWLPPTTRRVEAHGPERANRRIAQQIEASIRYHAAHPERIDQRLSELDAEWDIERTLEANAASIGLVGILLGILADRRFLVLPLAVSGFLLQHALQGWCPPVPFFRKRGVRTEAEINHERMALKALRGDFVPVAQPAMTEPRPRAEAAMRAAAA